MPCPVGAPRKQWSVVGLKPPPKIHQKNHSPTEYRHPFDPTRAPRHHRPDFDQYHGCSTTIILLWGKYSSLHTRHNLLSPRVHPRAPTGRRIPAQGETLGLSIQNRPRSEGTPHSIFIPVPHPCPRRHRPDSDQSHSTTSQVRPSYSMAWMTSKPTFWCALSERRLARAMSVTPH